MHLKIPTSQDDVCHTFHSYFIYCGHEDFLKYIKSRIPNICKIYSTDVSQILTHDNIRSVDLNKLEDIPFYTLFSSLLTLLYLSANKDYTEIMTIRILRILFDYEENNTRECIIIDRNTINRLCFPITLIARSTKNSEILGYVMKLNRICKSILAI